MSVIFSCLDGAVIDLSMDLLLEAGLGRSGRDNITVQCTVLQ